MKKFSLFCILSFVFCIGISFAYSNADVANAVFLSDNEMVVKQDTTSKYRLDDTILRQEAIGIALKIKGITLPDNYQCKKYFADATQNNWECRAVELAADNGIITRENKNANPGKLVTRSEALAMILSASNLDMSPWAGYSYYYDTNLYREGGVGYKDAYNFGAPWQARIFYQYIRAVLRDDTELKKNPRVNDYATRAEVFEFAVNTESMNMTIYVTDTILSPSKDCGATKPITVKVLRTKAVADTSLRYLFENYKPALSTYYQGVTIADSVASVKFSGGSLKYLNSPACEQMTYKGPIHDTLTQFPTVTSVQYIIDGELFDAWDA